MRQRLGDRHPVGLAQRRQYEDVAMAVTLFEFIGAEFADERDVFVELSSSTRRESLQLSADVV